MILKPEAPKSAKISPARPSFIMWGLMTQIVVEQSIKWYVGIMQDGQSEKNLFACYITKTKRRKKESNKNKRK